MRCRFRQVAANAAARYGLSWGLASSLVFDFHEVVFAVGMPRLSLSQWSILTELFGVAASALEMLLIILAFNTQGADDNTGRVVAPDSLTQVLSILSPDTKLVTLLLLVLPTAFLALRSPLALVAVPTLLWALSLERPGLLWGTADHYSAVLMPIVFAAFVEALTRVRSVR